MNKIPPHNIEAEQFVLGAAIRNPTILPGIRKILTPPDFYREAHQHIAEALFETKGDISLTEQYLRKHQTLEKAGGMDYLFELADAMLITAGTGGYIDIIKQLSHRRRIIQIAQEAADKAYQDIYEISDTLSDLKSDIRSLEVEHGEDYQLSAKLIKEVFDDIERKARENDPYVGVRTGFDNIDRELHGLEPKTTIYLMARPSAGKTSLSLQIAENVARQGAGRVVFFSLESSDIALTRRRLSAKSDVYLTAFAREPSTKASGVF